MRTPQRPIRLLFVTNLCPQYRVPLFEHLAKKYPSTFVFFSKGKEEYFKNQVASLGGDFRSIFLAHDAAHRWIPSIIRLGILLWTTPCDVVVKCINGKAELLLTFAIAKIRSKKFILWTGLWHHPQTLVHRMTRPIVRFIYSHSDAVVAYGTHVGKYLEHEGVGRNKIFIAWQATRNKFFKRPAGKSQQNGLRATLGLPKRRVFFLYVGRIERAKGIEVLLKGYASALNQADNIHLVIVGDGDFKKEMADLIHSLKIEEHCTLVPSRPLEVIRNLYSVCDVLVLPSTTTRTFKEPWGFVVNEAFNQGRTAIVSNAVGAAAGGLVVDHENGIIVEERSSDEIARAMILLTKNRRFLKKLQSKAKRSIRSWTYERMAGGFEGAIAYSCSCSK